MTRMRSWLVASMACALALGSEGRAGAELITFEFAGTVDVVFDGLGALGGLVQVGTPLTGFYTFDSLTPNTAPPVDEGEAGLYHHEAPPSGVQIQIGSFVFRSVPSSPDFDIIVNNNIGFSGADEYGFASSAHRLQVGRPDRGGGSEGGRRPLPGAIRTERPNMSSERSWCFERSTAGEPPSYARS